jgi:chromosomal replication initiation ATPase DnaA
MTTLGLTPNAEAHIAAVLHLYPITRQALLGPTKAHIACLARRDLVARLMCIPYKFKGTKPVYRSLPQAGRIIGKRDHTTVLYGLRRYAAEAFGTHPKAGLAEIREAWRAAQIVRAAA